MMQLHYMCEKCGSMNGRIRRPKKVRGEEQSYYFNLVVRCDKHLDNDME